jgi:hypothetical protein
VDGVERATYTEKAIPMQEYIVTGEEQLQVKCKNDEFFNESDFSNAITWNFAISGTPGMTYNVSWVTGIGTATTTELYIASIVNGVVITKISTSAFNDLDGYKIYCPDTITTLQGKALMRTKNTYIRFGEGLTTLEWACFDNMGSKMVFDFSRVKQIPTWTGGQASPKHTYIVPDKFYDTWITSTNWTKLASYIIRISEWIAQGGETV